MVSKRVIEDSDDDDDDIFDSPERPLQTHKPPIDISNVEQPNGSNEPTHQPRNPNTSSPERLARDIENSQWNLLHAPSNDHPITMEPSKSSKLARRQTTLGVHESDKTALGNNLPNGSSQDDLAFGSPIRRSTHHVHDGSSVKRRKLYGRSPKKSNNANTDFDWDIPKSSPPQESRSSTKAGSKKGNQTRQEEAESSYRWLSTEEQQLNSYDSSGGVARALDRVARSNPQGISGTAFQSLDQVHVGFSIQTTLPEEQKRQYMQYSSMASSANSILPLPPSNEIILADPFVRFPGESSTLPDTPSDPQQTEFPSANSEEYSREIRIPMEPPEQLGLGLFPSSLERIGETDGPPNIDSGRFTEPQSNHGHHPSKKKNRDRESHISVDDDDFTPAKEGRANKQSPPQPIPSDLESIRQKEDHGVKSHTKRKKKAELSSEALTGNDLTFSDELAIGLPKEEYKPRPSQSRANNDVDELIANIDLSKRPELQARKKKIKRAKTTGSLKPPPRDNDDEVIIVDEFSMSPKTRWKEDMPITEPAKEADKKSEVPQEPLGAGFEVRISKEAVSDELKQHSHDSETVQVAPSAKSPEEVRQPKKRGRKRKITVDNPPPETTPQHDVLAVEPKPEKGRRGRKRKQTVEHVAIEIDTKPSASTTDPIDPPAFLNDEPSHPIVYIEHESTRATPLTERSPNKFMSGPPTHGADSSKESGIEPIPISPKKAKGEPLPFPQKPERSVQTPDRGLSKKGPDKHSPLSSSRVTYRVGLSRRARIEPLLKRVIKK
ncbi:MAG: hypothetical protein M1834_004195 [Cirrosporium novae-zelandiae]|nr:MAG: hypothetical protein M1834_004195 [Cirrosporium novae-zelandiae]